MAKPSREEIQAELTRGMILTHERHVTIRTGIIAGAVVAVSIVIGFVLIKIYAQQSLIDLLMVLFAPGGFVAVILGALLLGGIRKVNRLQNELMANTNQPAQPTSGSFDHER